MSQLDAVWYTKGKAAVPLLCVPPVFFSMTLSKLVLLDWVSKGEIEDWIAGIQPHLHKCDRVSVKINSRNSALCCRASGQVQGWHKKQAQTFLLPDL